MDKKRFPKTDIAFDLYDTQKLKQAHEQLTTIYNYNYDNSRKCRLLETIINKLERLIEEHGHTEV